MQLLRRTGSMRAEWLVLVLVLLAVLNDAAATEDRPIDQYANSGYFFPKTIIWHGLRSPPGSLWLGFLGFLSGAIFAVMLVLLTHIQPEEVPEPDTRDSDAEFKPEILAFFEAYLLSAVGGGLMYVSLAVNSLSDVMEAYLVGLCSVQLILDAKRGVHAQAVGKFEFRLKPSKDSFNASKDLVSVLAFSLPSVFGIALLDSYRPLSKLNLAYFVVGNVICQVMLTVTPFLQPHRLRVIVRIVASLVHLGFAVFAFLLADRVEGTHRSPMIAYLATAGVVSILVSWIESCFSKVPTVH